MTSRSSLTVAVVAATATACSSAGAGALAPPSAAERQSLATLRAHVRGPSVASEIFADRDAHAVAIAVMQQLRDPAVPAVHVYRWDHRAWQQVAGVSLDVGGSVTPDGGGAPTPIRTADVTPASTPDLVVTVYYNAGPATAILSSYGGRWHALTFHGGLTQDGDERFDAQVRPDGTVTAQDNDCVPNCAEGHQVRTSYRFSTATGRLEGTLSR